MGQTVEQSGDTTGFPLTALPLPLRTFLIDAMHRDEAASVAVSGRPPGPVVHSVRYAMVWFGLV